MHRLCPHPPSLQAYVQSPRWVHRLTQSGLSAVEFLLVSVPVLLLSLGGVELAHWFHVRQVVDFALLQAARAGATHYAQPQAMADAFEDALRPLFTASPPQTSHARLARILSTRRLAMDNAPPWQIRILRPNAQDFAQFGQTALAIARTSGLTAIRNDYQYEQAQLASHPSSFAQQDSNIFQANTLVLQLTYPHKPLLPGIGHLVSSLSTHTQPYARRAHQAGLLPMVRELQLDMASHPVQWPPLADGRVIRADAAETSTTDFAPTACVGLWCQAKPSLAQSTTPTSEPIYPVGDADLPAWDSGSTPPTPSEDSAQDTLPADDVCP